MNAKVKVNGVACLTVMLESIKQATKNYQEKPDDKREARLKEVIREYISTCADLVEQGAISSDPYGIVTKSNVGDAICIKLIDQIVLEMGGDKGRGMNLQLISTTLENATKGAMATARGIKTRTCGVFSNGARWLFDSETGKLSIFWKGVCSRIKTMKDGIVLAYAVIMERLRSLFSGKKAAGIELEVQKLTAAETEVKDGKVLEGTLCPAV